MVDMFVDVLDAPERASEADECLLYGAVASGTMGEPS
jgi:hypothetical protein